MDLIPTEQKDIPESGQIIYSELAVAEFPKLKEYLIQEIGYKPEEIGIITEQQIKIKELLFKMILIWKNKSSYWK